jgi:ribonuclease-3
MWSVSSITQLICSVKVSIDQAARRLGLKFERPELLRQALSHRSSGRDNYERLEFLGDALIGLFAAELLFERLPHASESDLTRVRAAWVQESGLAQIARELNLGDFLILGESERKSGGWRRESILADALEALVGAIFLDAGYARAREVVRAWLLPRVEAMPSLDDYKDAKTRLQEWLQGRRLPLPSYELLETQGADHQRVFTVGLYIAAVDKHARGTGSSRRSAEQMAALQMLELLELRT